MALPGAEEIRALHLRHAPTQEAFDLVHTHCVIVRHITRELLARAPVRADTELAPAGALLHDIGVYRLYGPDGTLDGADYVRHGVLGHELLREEGLPEELCRFCSHHTGVGLTAHDVRAQRLPLPPGDYLAETMEERAVMYADKFHSKTAPPVFLTAAAYARHVVRFGADKVRSFDRLRAEFGEPDVRALAARFGHAVR
ncbi:HDIG domain-containing metalloprotein [Streptomyces sp. NPDC003703]|uniref:HDIG domain-containing metalloprotein n=1 Tax=Streptomyces sp. NPDC003283 TaxID=3364681 RepID=UPI0036BE59A1